MATAPTTLNEFRSKFSDKGFARPNFFELRIDIPDATMHETGDLQEWVTYAAKATNLPGVTMTTMEYYYAGRAMKLPGERAFEPWTCSFYVDKEFSTKMALYDWINYNLPAETGYHGDNSTGDQVYKNRPIKVKVLDRNKQGSSSVHEITLFHCYPTTIQGQELDMAANDQIMEISVQWDYTYFEVTKRSNPS